MTHTLSQMNAEMPQNHGDASNILTLRPPNVLAADCPSRQVLKHLTSQWGTLVLLALQPGTLRFSALRRTIGGVSERMLAQTLQVLEGDGLILRHAHQVVPPHVDYSLTALGADAARHIADLTGWIEASLPTILAHRANQE